MNFAREPEESGASSAVNLTTSIPKTPAAAVFQDGITQPWIIEPNGHARIAGDYDSWTMSNREFVPIGKQMLFSNGILYVADREGRIFYRSIAGRPLDFMINVTPAGDKSGADAAVTTSHSIGFDALTCLASLNSPDGGFFAATSNLSTRVVPDFENTVFDQPQFDNIDLFPTGPLNQFSFVETDGDNAFVNLRGIRSFNAALQERSEGKNQLFSAKILDFFNGVTQTGTCATKFDNYLLFGVQTVYGDAWAVYDETIQRWVGLDMHGGIERTKQFAVVQKGSVEKLFFITTDNRVYEAFADDETATCSLYLGDYCSQRPDTNQLPVQLNVVIINAEESGTLTITPFIDGRRQSNQSKPQAITANYVAAIPRSVPFGAGDTTNVQNVPFAIKNVDQGWKCGFLLELDCMAEISHVQATSSDEETPHGLKAQVAAFRAAA